MERASIVDGLRVMLAGERGVLKHVETHTALRARVAANIETLEAAIAALDPPDPGPGRCVLADGPGCHCAALTGAAVAGCDNWREDRPKPPTTGPIVKPPPASVHVLGFPNDVKTVYVPVYLERPKPAQ